jgi:hypothetical protein
MSGSRRQMQHSVPDVGMGACMRTHVQQVGNHGPLDQEKRRRLTKLEAGSRRHFAAAVRGGGES